MKNFTTLFIILWHTWAMPQFFNQEKPIRFFIGTEMRLPVMGESYYLMHIKDTTIQLHLTSYYQPNLSFGVEWKIHPRWSLLFWQNYNTISQFPTKNLNPSYTSDALYITKDFLLAVRYQYYLKKNKSFSMDWGHGKLNKGLYFYSINNRNEIYKTDMKASVWVFQNTFHVKKLSMGIGLYFSFNPGDYYWTKGFFGILYAHVKYDIFRY